MKIPYSINLVPGFLAILLSINLYGQQGADDWGPEPSPNGEQIAFYSTRGGSDLGRIFLMNADGSNLRELPYEQTGGHDIEPSWSPDGRRIAFTSQSNFKDGSVSARTYVMNSDGSNLKLLYDHDEDENGATHFGDWNADGSAFYFFYWSYGGFEPNIYVRYLEKEKVKQLTSDNQSYQPRFANGAIWFSSNRSGEPLTYRMDDNGQNVVAVHELVNRSYTYGLPGNKNFYYCAADEQQQTANFFKHNLSNSKVSELATIDHVPAYFLALAEEQQYIVHSVMGENNHDINKLDLTSGEIVSLISD